MIFVCQVANVYYSMWHIYPRTVHNRKAYCALHLFCVSLGSKSPGLMQSLFSGGVWGGRVPTPRGYPAPPQMILSGGCGAAKKHHNHQKKECARDAVPRAPNVAT